MNQNPTRRPSYTTVRRIVLSGEMARAKAVRMRVDRNRMSIKVRPRGNVHTGVKKSLGIHETTLGELEGKV